MFKRTFTPIFILIALAATAWGQETAELDIVIRDFSAPANTLNERQAANYAGYYGFQEFDYSKSNSEKECSTSSGQATQGMVRDSLDYSQCSADERKGTTWEQRAANGRYCARPIPTNSPSTKMCYGEYLQNWYTNVPEAKVFKEVMTLRCNNGLCEINDDAYFPLDKYQDSETWGKQNPASGTKHNYGFTVAGSGEFKYVASNNDNFAFKGDDDMWVFIDGILVIDLGGVHTEVRDSISINDIARARGWADNSMHSINFFYAERQITSSHLRLTFRLTDLVPSQFGAPYIKKAETTIKDGNSETMIWVSTKLDLESIEKFIGTDQYPIIIRKSDPEKKDVNGYRLTSITFKEVDGSNGYVYIIEGSACDSKTECKLAISGGDSLSFNVKPGDLRDAGYSDSKGFTLPGDSWYIKSSIGVEATKVTWAPNTTQMNSPPFVPIPGDKNPVKPDFVNEWFTGNPSDGNCAVCGNLPPSGTFPNINQIWDPERGEMVSDDPNLTTNTTVRGFGKTGTPIPPQRAGELILTAFPNASGMVRTPKGTMTYAEWLEDKEVQKLFGLPPEVSDYGPYGLADPKKQADNGGFAFVKNGFPNESSVGSNGRIAPTRCIADVSKPDEPRINCLNFSLLAKQPFQISVILYDQLGNFVTQYRETISEKEFRSVVQGPNYVAEEQTNVKNLSRNASNDCQEPKANNFGQPNVLTTNGLVKVNVNIYPFAKDGRRFGNGVYIAKIDRVDLPYEGCMNNEGMPTFISADYMRYHAEQKFGWMRTKAKK